MVNIVQRDDKILRQIAKEVPLSQIGSPKIAKIIENMKTALKSQPDGVAIAAPQIGVPLKIFVVSGKVNKIAEKEEAYKKAEGSGLAEIPEEIKKEIREKNYPDMVFINPTIKKLSKESATLEEGCLSIRYAYGKIRRAKKATIEAYNENSKKFVKGASGLLAQIFQHETDHLVGKLFTDEATNVRELPPEEWQNSVGN